MHSTVRLVTAAIKGYEPVTGDFQQFVRQLASNEVPRRCDALLYTVLGVELHSPIASGL